MVASPGTMPSLSFSSPEGLTVVTRNSTGLPGGGMTIISSFPEANSHSISRPPSANGAIKSSWMRWSGNAAASLRTWRPPRNRGVRHNRSPIPIPIRLQVAQVCEPVFPFWMSLLCIGCGLKVAPAINNKGYYSSRGFCPTRIKLARKLPITRVV